MRIGLGIGMRKPSGQTPVQRAINLLKSKGADAHLWDFSTLTGLYQDSAGVTPVTAPDQPIGLCLDSMGVLGSELVTNGDFSNGTTGWSNATGASLSVVSGALRSTSTVSGASARIATQTVAGLTVGATYRVTANVLAFGGAGAQAANPSMQIRNAADTVTTATIAATGLTNAPISGYFVATDTSHRIRPRWDGNASTNTTSYLDFDNISVREITGIHASQATSANKATFRASGSRTNAVFDATDSMTSTFPAGYESATIIDGLSTGQVTSTANIVGSYTMGPNVTRACRIVVKGALTASELALLQKLANSKAGISL
jgi:hypothetical protein